MYFRKRADWSRKQFLGQVNFSLTYVGGGTMAMRTLLETTAQKVWLNDLGVKKVAHAAARTTADQPFVSLDDPKDMDFVYRAVLNVLSEKFAEAFLAETLGVPVTTTGLPVRRHIRAVLGHPHAEAAGAARAGDRTWKRTSARPAG